MKEESKYKESVNLLIEHLNNLAKDPLKKFKGNFRVEEINRSSIKENGVENSVTLFLVYTDVSSYTPIRIDVILKPVGEILQPEPDPYKYFYNDLMNFILLTSDTSEEMYKDARGSTIVTIPFGKLLKEGYKRI